MRDQFIHKRQVAATVKSSPQNQRWVKEIIHHLARGRGVASISGWLNLPPKVITRIMKQHGLRATEKGGK